MTKPAIEVVRDGEPDRLNNVPYYAPVGVLPDGREGGAFGGSEQYARRKARSMEQEISRDGKPRYVRVYIRLTWSAGAVAG